jgi:hypothetical protein
LCEDEDWIYLAEESVQWQTPVNVIMNHQVPYKTENFFIRASLHNDTSIISLA